MTGTVEIQIGDLFEPRNGKAIYIRDYLDDNPGPYPVYSASLLRPFGMIDSWDYEGTYLTWVMNGYGGRVQEVAGKFSANRDRGVFVPRDGVDVPDLTYLRFAMEPQLAAAAVGRRVDGRLNEYTKIYPNAAADVVIELPVHHDGGFDYDRMETIGDRLRRIEAAQIKVRGAEEALSRAVPRLELEPPTAQMSLGDAAAFSLDIGERRLKTEMLPEGIPIFSANPLKPFGYVAKSNLSDFSKPSLLWGIDGVFAWNLIPAGEPFATTDHCGRLQVLNPNVDPDYLYAYLRATRSEHGFDRVFRASLRNVRSDINVVVPVDGSGEPSLSRQKLAASMYQATVMGKSSAIIALTDVLRARVAEQ